MKKLLTYAVGIAVCLGTSAVLANSGIALRTHQVSSAEAASDGAFRDGLYLGRLTAESGRPFHAPMARWSTEKDRASFVAGYRNGYGRSVAVAVQSAH
jgi:hypothetical protein